MFGSASLPKTPPITKRKRRGSASVKTIVVGSRKKSFISTQVSFHSVFTLLLHPVPGEVQEDVFQRWLLEPKVVGNDAVMAQSAEQPSPLALFPSSHSSPLSRLPSPQKGSGTDASTGGGVPASGFGHGLKRVGLQTGTSSSSQPAIAKDESATRHKPNFRLRSIL